MKYGRLSALLTALLCALLLTVPAFAEEAQPVTEEPMIEAPAAEAETPAQTGWVETDAGWMYYEDDSCYACGDVYYIDGYWYVFNDSGIMQTGWATVDVLTMYCDSDGKVVSGLQVIDGKTYYFNDDHPCPSMTINKMVEVSGGSFYYFTSTGAAAVNQWYTDDDGYKYYFGSDGKAINGFQTIDGKTYYFDPYMFADTSVWIDDALYYFKPSGVMATNYLYKDSNGDYYYFGSDGKAISGWKKISGNWYYFKKDEGMRAAKNEMLTIGKNVYCFNSKAVMITNSWYKYTYWADNSKWYYLGSDGKAVTGWKYLGGAWYYFDENHEMVADSKYDIGNATYYFNARGAMVTNSWYKYTYWSDNVKWYYFGSDGKAVTGWKYISGAWYYFDSYHEMVSGSVYKIGNTYYYFKANGTMGKNCWGKDTDGTWYYFGSNGKAITGWKQLGGKWYYFAPQMLSNRMQMIAGKTYYFKSSGAMAVNYWYKDNFQNWYYFKSTGVMAKSETLTIGGKKYTFDANGVMQ